MPCPRRAHLCARLDGATAWVGGSRGVRRATRVVGVRERPPPSRVLLRTVARPPAGLLLRDFLHRALTDRASGYFAQPDAPVGRIRDPIDFSSLLGQEDYARALDARAPRLSAQWLTPRRDLSAPLRPRGGCPILRAHRDSHPDQPLRVYELGGGTGTCAANFLAHVRDAAPDVYARACPTSPSRFPASSPTRSDAPFETSFETIRNVSTRPRLPPQSETSTRSPHRVHRVEVRDATDRAGWGAVDRAPCFVVALEVLDGLPHDRVARGTDGAWTQTRVAADAAGAPFEVLEPLTDPLIRRVVGHAVTDSADLNPKPGGARGLLDAARRAFDVATGMRTSRVVFVPTGAARLLGALHDARPNHRLVAADFDALPGVRMEGANAPIVASRGVGGKTVDRDTYLEDPGRADVFFPTDFRALARMDRRREGTGRGAGAGHDDAGVHGGERGGSEGDGNSQRV